MTSKLALQTRQVHAGEQPVQGSVTMPIFQSATYLHSGDGVYHDVRYTRLSNTPNHLSLHKKLKNICEAPAALVTSSGMSAITTTLLSILSAGDHILTQDTIYGGTHSFLRHDAPNWGIEVGTIDPQAPHTWEAALRPTTRVLYVESMTNPLVQVADLQAVVDFAKAHGLISIIDSTFASPVNFRPIPVGFDLCVHSATKYLNGHSDVIAGCVVGREDLVAKIARTLDHLGGCLDPHAAYLLQRGMKTLTLRVRQQNQNAQALAEALLAHDAVDEVHYPGLESHPHHTRAKALFEGCGGVLSFTLKGDVAQAETLIDALHLAAHAPSLGGVETLITRPATTSHAGLSPEERSAQGIHDTLIRVAVGIEDTQDLINDFTQALETTR